MQFCLINLFFETSVKGSFFIPEKYYICGCDR